MAEERAPASGDERPLPPGATADPAATTAAAAKPSRADKKAAKAAAKAAAEADKQRQKGVEAKKKESFGTIGKLGKLGGRSTNQWLLREDPELAAIKARRERAAGGTGGEQTELLHSAQLDERLRTGEAEATPKDRRNKALLDTLVFVGLFLILAGVLGRVGIPVALDNAVQTYILALAAIVLAGASYLFNTIRWRALRAASGAKVLHKARADLLLTTVSIMALFTVFFIAVVEIIALLVFIGLFEDLGRAGASFAGNFVLFQAIIQLVYLLCLIARENNVSTFQPKASSLQFAAFLTPFALLIVVVGAVMASGFLQLGVVQPHQGIYVVTLGVGLEFLAMRTRIRLPSLWSQFTHALEQTRRANEEVRDQMRKRAIRAYVVGALFVAFSMAFAGAVATGVVGLGNARLGLAITVFYVGGGIVLIGLLVLRLLQHRTLDAKKPDEADELARLVQQKRKSPEEVFRMSVYIATGITAGIAAVVMLLTGMGLMPWHKKFATDIFILAVLFGAGPFGYFANREAKRILAVDEKFPDFLRDIAESNRAGMTLPRALVTAANGTYGALTPEIQVMAAQVEWGVSFGDALDRFAKRCRTPLISRTVALINEAQRAGGSMVEILTAASDDSREIKQIIGERNSQMGMYNVVIYIAFFVFISVVLVLAAQFIPAFKEAVGAASGSSVGGLNFKDFDPEDFNTAFFHAALVQAIGGGLVGGVLTRGNPVFGFMHIGVMMAAAWVSFRVIVGLM
jgi:archaeal flagellar protein FlaJ